MGRGWSVIVGCVLLVGCGAPSRGARSPRPSAVPEIGDVSPAPDAIDESAWEHEVPLTAPDEREAEGAPRLPQSKTIGDEGAYDLGRAKGRAAPAVGPRPLPSTPTYYRLPRGYARGYRGMPAGGSTGGAVANTGASAGGGPAVAGNWPSAPSYGPRAMK